MRYKVRDGFVFSWVDKRGETQTDPNLTEVDTKDKKMAPFIERQMHKLEPVQDTERMEKPTEEVEDVPEEDPQAAASPTTRPGRARAGRRGGRKPRAGTTK